MASSRSVYVAFFGLAAIGLVLAALGSCIPRAQGQRIVGESSDFYEGPGVSTSEILKARGYLAKDFQVRSKDGYWLRVTRGRNPLINNGTGGLPGRAPIMFIHGILSSYNVFVINSFDVQPSDFSNASLTESSLEELYETYGDVPSAKSLPLLAMDFGHEVFIMSRRGFPGSQGRDGDSLSSRNDEKRPPNRGRPTGPLSAFLGLTFDFVNLPRRFAFSFSKKFWNFSLDEQAKYDFPKVVDFIRNQTKREKIAVVGHSAGGSLALMALSLYPKLNNKLSSVILWSQGFSLGHGDPFNSLTLALPLLNKYIGSVPPAFTVRKIQAFLGLFCANKLTQTILCESIADLFLGPSDGQEPMRSEFLNSLLYPSSSHEIAQLLQCVLLGGQMHHYARNLKAATPYNLSRITNANMSFYAATSDSLVPVSDVNATLPLLKTSYKYHLINATFNHNGYFYHNNASRLVIIPTLQEIQQMHE